MTAPRLIAGLHGLGDNLMQRPFVRAMAKRVPLLFVQTPWPELYADLGAHVRVVRTGTRLRTQAKNEAASEVRWASPPRNAVTIKVFYGLKELREHGSMLRAIEAALPLGDEILDMDMPRLCDPPAIDPGGRPVAIVRPVTIRREWHSQSRSPDPRLLADLASRLMGTHYVVSVADLEPEHEALDGPEPPCHLRLHRAEWSTMQVLEAMRRADLLLGGHGFITHVAQATGTPAVILLGGCGGLNSEATISDPRMPRPNIRYIVPTRHCLCTARDHPCDKRVDDLDAQWDRAMAVLSSGPCPRST